MKVIKKNYNYNCIFNFLDNPYAVCRKKGPEITMNIGQSISNKKALILYDPDAFYNLDAQISKSFAQGLAKKGWVSKIVTISSAKNSEDEQFDLYVFCANTYNWSPGGALSNYIKKHGQLKGKNVIAITLGSGSTKRSKRILETLIKQKEAKLIDSKVFWLLRPNDELKMNESNVKVAVEMAQIFGNGTAHILKTTK
jgi:hypothetical protein